MREIVTRELGDGSMTTIALYLCDDGTFTVEAINCNGTSSGKPTADEALDWFQHPFCNEARLDYPVPGRHAQQRALTADEYALAEAIVEVEA
jgi:hypothetical protein